MVFGRSSPGKINGLQKTVIVFCKFFLVPSVSFSLLKIAQCGDEPGIIRVSLIFSPKQRLRPLSYWTPFPLVVVVWQTTFCFLIVSSGLVSTRPNLEPMLQKFRARRFRPKSFFPLHSFHFPWRRDKSYRKAQTFVINPSVEAKSGIWRSTRIIPKCLKGCMVREDLKVIARLKFLWSLT